MKKFVVAGLLVAGFATPAFAAEYYVAQNNSTHKMLDPVEEARRQDPDHARHRGLQDEVRRGKRAQGHGRM